MAGADDIGNGFPVGVRPHELRELRWDHDVAKLEQQLLPLNTERMGKQQFRVKARCIVLVRKPDVGGAESLSRLHCQVAPDGSLHLPQSGRKESHTGSALAISTEKTSGGKE